MKAQVVAPCRIGGVLKNKGDVVELSEDGYRSLLAAKCIKPIGREQEHVASVMPESVIPRKRGRPRKDK
jgi:hypothetical protein